MDISQSGNLLDAVKSLITPNVMQQASQFIGQPADKTRSGFAAAIPTMLAGLVQKGSTESGARGLMDMIQSGGFDKVTDAQSLLQAAGKDPTGAANRGILNSVFGDSLGNAENFIAKNSGLNSAGSASILGMLAPVVMGVVGMKSRGLGVSGFMNMLTQQKDSIAHAAPEGMSNIMQWKDMGARQIKRTAEYVGNKMPHMETQKKPNWLIPTLIAVAVLAGLYWFGRSRSQIEPTDTRTTQRAPIDTPAQTLDSLDNTRVRQLQLALNRQGYSVPVDGVMGQNTRHALIDFQNKHNLAGAGPGVMTTKTAEQLGLPSDFMMAH